jgi:hypothetical protein
MLISIGSARTAFVFPQERASCYTYFQLLVSLARHRHKMRNSTVSNQWTSKPSELLGIRMWFLDKKTGMLGRQMGKIKGFINIIYYMPISTRIRGSYMPLHGTCYLNWLRYYVIGRKVVGSISVDVRFFFSWSNPYNCNLTLRWTQSLINMSTRYLRGCWGWLTCNASNLIAASTSHKLIGLHGLLQR